MQAHARVCEENKLEIEKNEILLKHFAVKESTLKGYRRTVALPIMPNFMTRIVRAVMTKS